MCFTSLLCREPEGSHVHYTSANRLDRHLLVKRRPCGRHARRANQYGGVAMHVSFPQMPQYQQSRKYHESDMPL